ncbi:MAG: DNA polymerase III subunit alpha [Pseudomonadota bacterium]
MQHANFVHLHVHSYYSLLDGACPLDKLIAKAREHKLPALAVTDHGNMFCAVEFYQSAQKAGLKPLIGCECYLLAKGSRLTKDIKQEGYRTHITLLVKNAIGYKNLCKLVSSSYLEGFYYKPRIDKEILREYNEGLIALSGCIKGEVCKSLLDSTFEQAESVVDEMTSIFNNDRYFLEIMDNGLPEQARIRSQLIDLSKKKGVGLVATNDVHYLAREDAPSQDALLCIQTGKNLTDTNRLRLSTDEFYFRTPEEMSELFKDCPEAIDNTVHIAGRLNLEMDFNTYHFPKFEPPENYDLATYLEERAREGLKKHWPLILQYREAQDGPEIQKEYDDRLNHELEVIKSMGFAGYFLIVADFIDYARSQDLPVGPGRGSAAGSLVAYALGITDIEPIENGLLFERFLNPERISMPDVDIDFCMRRRDEVIAYVAKKYGNVSQIITFGKMKARAVVRDVGRVMGVPYGDVDRIAKMIPATLGMNLELALKVEPKLKKLANDDPQIGKLIETSRFLEGFPRHASTHAAGVVISDKPLSDFLPLYKGQHDETVTQFDMKAVEKIGLIKFDFLGLRTLTVIDDCLKLIVASGKGTLDIERISLKDELVYKHLSDGDTAGVFQLESSGMTDLVIKLKPGAFSDIVALVALFRPGPLGSGMVDDFIDRKHGRKSISYELPQLEDILKDTYGVIVYQEQVMQIASLLGGFSLGEADILRRAMGKKKADEMSRQRERFLEGAKKNKIPEKKAEKIFDLMAMFAEYGFNKSHSAAYALVSYRTAYLKYHYPAEYMAALLTSEKDNTDKIINYINDCKNHEIEVLPPDVNQSQRDFSVVGDKSIRFGLGAVKNVGAAAIDIIVAARSEKGDFRDIYNFCERVDGRKVNRRVVESLIKCGAFDTTDERRSAIFANLDEVMEFASGRQKERQIGQSNIFDSVGVTDLNPKKLVEVAQWDEHQTLAYEKESLGFFITGHPLTQYQALLKTYATADTQSIVNVPDKRDVKIGGVVLRLKEITTKKGHRMGFLTIEDLKGSVEVVVFSELYVKSVTLLKSDKSLFVTGKVDNDGESCKIIAEDIYPLDEVVDRLTKSIHFNLTEHETSQKHMTQLKNMISRFPGACYVFLHLFSSDGAETVLKLPDDMRISPSQELVKTVTKYFGHDIVKFSSETT